MHFCSFPFVRGILSELFDRSDGEAAAAAFESPALPGEAAAAAAAGAAEAAPASAATPASARNSD